MVRILGEATVNLLLSTLIGVLGFIVLRNYDHAKRISVLESIVVKASDIERMEGRIDRMADAMQVQEAELTRLRTSVTELLLPALSDHVKEIFHESIRSGVDPDGGPGDAE